jgi:two-component system nitrate/nitrite sensor histidine kinase NarX
LSQQKQHFFQSVMNYIHLSLILIIGITLLSIFFSFWITEQADTDAQAINLSGSMRMKTYHIGLAITYDPQAVAELIKVLDDTWTNQLFSHARFSKIPTDLTNALSLGSNHWFNVVRPMLKSTPESEEIYTLLTKQVALTDNLVNQFQQAAEMKIRDLRTLQLIAFLVTTLVSCLIFYLLKNRVETPLRRLSKAAEKIRDGHIEQDIEVEGKDELSMFAVTFNQMSKSITETYKQLETRVEERTAALQQNNTVLTFSFGLARKILDMQAKNFDYQETLKDLAEALNLKNIELCLFTSEGERPYFHIDPNEDDAKLCTKISCDTCKESDSFNAVETLGFSSKFLIGRNNRQYGVINVKRLDGTPLPPWQDQLLRSSADQLAIALSLQETKEQEHRLAMLSERTVIARELHDSLAQSLSYLKIQVARLQKSHDLLKYDQQQPIIDELREGLSSAYRHLRELLTTFRLKIDDEGLEGAILQAVDQLKARSDMNIQLNYKLKDVPLSPSEEIHLLQILREASQNSTNHSHGKKLEISLSQREDKNIELIIKDDGIGLPEAPEKLNHYGLAIIKERSRNLNAVLSVNSTPENDAEHGNTKITLHFKPSYLVEQSTNHLLSPNSG